MSQDYQLSFKFFYVKAKSRKKKGITGKDGYLLDNEILLDNEKIPLISIGATYSREKRIVITILRPDQVSESIRNNIQNNRLILEISGQNAEILEKKIDNSLSLLLANIHFEKLRNEGRENIYKTHNCSNCGSIIDISGFTQTNYIYCRFCNSIMNLDYDIISDRNTFEQCDHCRLFSIVNNYSLFFFYFLLFVFGFRHENRKLCGNCAEKIGKKLLLINLLFILGVPSAISMILKARKNSKKGEKELKKANKFILKGDYQSADSYFNDLRELFPGHPGIIYSQARAHIYGKDFVKGYDYLVESLQSCSNYGPSLVLFNNVKRNSKSPTYS